MPQAVSCPTPSLCVAVDGGSGILTSTNPTGGAGAWSTTTIAGAHQFSGLSCPTVSLCVVIDSGGEIVTSTDPTAGASAWTVGSPVGSRFLYSVSCGSATSCVASDDRGDILVSQNPAGGAQTWKVVNVDRFAITAVSCAPNGPCVGADAIGGVLASTDPSGGAQAWTLTSRFDPNTIDSVACQSASLCLAGDLGGSVAVSTAPAAANPGWTVSPPLAGGLRQPGLTAISCPSTSLCVATDDSGDTVATARPTAASWALSEINPGLSFSGISCPSTQFCAAVGSDHVATTVQPLAGSQAWNLADLKLFSHSNFGPMVDELTAIGCTRGMLCVATRYSAGADNLEVSRQPLQGARTWHAEALGEFNFDFFRAVSCPSKALCVAADAQGGTVAVSTDGARSWRFAYVESPSAMNGSLTPSVNDVSCPTKSFCAAVDTAGHVITTHHPAGGAKRWHRTRLDGGHTLRSISCASPSFCAAIDHRGHVLFSRRPAGGARFWRRARVGKGLTGISCPSARLCVISTDAGAVIVGRRRRRR